MMCEICNKKEDKIMFRNQFGIIMCDECRDKYLKDL